MSATDRFLSFAFSHQTVIIEILFAVILAIVVVWLFLHLRQENEAAGDGHNVQDIESALRRVLQTTDVKMSTTAADAVGLIKDDEDDDLVVPDISLPPPSAPSGSAGTGPVSDPGEISKLKMDLDDKTKKLVELEKSLRQAKEEAAKVGATGANTDELQNKIKALESRLAEYEIIEDDIANLSIYKEENVRLRSELERLKRGGTDAGAAPAAAAEPAAPAPQAAAAPEAATPVTPAAPAAPAPAAAAEAAAPRPASVPAESAVPGGSDIAAAMAETMAAITPPPEPPQSTIEKAKADAIDSDKLLKEFDSLVNGAKPAEPAKPADDKKSGDKLIEEFENFMKGNSG